MVIGKLGRAGAESQLVALASGLAGRGDRVTVADLTRGARDADPLIDAGVKLLRFDTSPGMRRAAVLPSLVRVAHRHDLVHCTMWDASLWGRLAAIAARRPVVVSDHSAERGYQTSHSGVPRQRLIALHNRLLEPATAVTVACAQAQVPLLESEGVRSVVHIPNGVSLEALRESARRGPSRGQLGIPQDARIMIHVARFHPLKNQRVTFETTARLREALGDVHVIFVGDGEGRSALQQEAMSTGADWAHFLGRRTDVPALLSLSELAVLPSLSEAMPMAIVEAMALGVPVVATAVGDVAATLESTGAGVHVPPGDSDAFFKACRDVLTDPELRSGLASRALVSAEGLTVEAMTERYSELFDAVLECRSRSGAWHAERKKSLPSGVMLPDSRDR